MKISVVMPVYSSDSIVVARAIESILNQTLGIILFTLLMMVHQKAFPIT